MGNGFYVIVALGDSLTFGYRVCDPYGLEPRSSYPAQLEALLREKIKGREEVSVVNAGVNGDSTDGMIWRFNQSVASERPDVSVIWGGINDLNAMRTPEQVMNNLSKLYSMCSDVGLTPVACTLTPTKFTGPKIRSLNELIKAYALEKDILLADFFPALADGEGNLRCDFSDDGVHLTQSGYRLIAEITRDTLLPLISNKVN